MFRITQKLKQKHLRIVILIKNQNLPKKYQGLLWLSTVKKYK